MRPNRRHRRRGGASPRAVNPVESRAVKQPALGSGGGMKRAVLLVATFALFAMVVGVVAQDKAVSGTWQLTQPGRNGDVTQTLTLDQKGGDITGTMKMQNGDVPVTGSISGSDIT